MTKTKSKSTKEKVKKKKRNYPDAIPPPPPKPMRIPLSFLKPGDWFKFFQDDDPTLVQMGQTMGFMEKMVGQHDVQVQLRIHHGKNVNERPPPWSGETAIYRIKQPDQFLLAVTTQEKKEKGEDKPKKAPVAARDRIGCFLHAASGRINNHLTEEPQQIAKIAKAAGLPESRVKGHLKFWVKEGVKEEYPHEWRIVGDEKKGFCFEKVSKEKPKTKKKEKK